MCVWKREHEQRERIALVDVDLCGESVKLQELNTLQEVPYILEEMLQY